jgi:LacI family transcriptional regulator
MRRIAVMVYGRRPATAIDLVSGIAELGSRRGWQLLVRSVEDPSLLPMILGGGVHGVIAMAQSKQQASELAATRVPLVNVITGYMVGKAPTVRINDRHVGRLAAEHLASLGHRRLAYLGVDVPDNDLRADGFSAEVLRLGLEEVRPDLPQTPEAPPTLAPRRFFTWDEIATGEILDPWLKTVETPVGVLCFNDHIAAALVDACARVGLSVPDDVAVLGVDNDELLCPYSAVPLSSVDPGLKQIGYRAAEVLEATLSGKPPTLEVIQIANHRIVQRRSTETLVVDDPVVREAVQFIRSRVGQPLAVSHVMKKVRLSRATLDRRFQSVLGRTVGEEIRRMRARTAGRLLRDTKLKLADIARRSGFASQQHLCRAFRLAYGLSPGAYRKREALSGGRGFDVG